MEKVKIVFGNKDVSRTVTLTKHEYLELKRALASMVEWETGGMYGNGEIVDDKRGMAMAKKVLKKLS